MQNVVRVMSGKRTGIDSELGFNSAAVSCHNLPAEFTFYPCTKQQQQSTLRLVLTPPPGLS